LSSTSGKPISAALFNQIHAARSAQAAATGVLEVGQQVGKTRAHAQHPALLWQRAVVVTLQRHELGFVGRKGLQGAKVSGRFDRHPAAGSMQHLAHQVQPLLRAGGDQHLRSRLHVHALHVAISAATHSRSGAKPSLAAYCKASRGLSRSTACGGFGCMAAPERCRPKAGHRPAR
jgi:hypothetical protein